MNRYQKIQSSIWHDEKFTNLSQQAKLLFLYILTCPHSNTIGIFVLPKMYIINDLKWSPQQLGKPFTELLGKQSIMYDETVDLVLIPNHLKHNPLENENQTKSARKILLHLPKSPLYSIVSEQLGKPYHKLLRELLKEQYREPEEEEEEEEEEETEEEDKPIISIIKFSDFLDGFNELVVDSKLNGSYGKKVPKAEYSDERKEKYNKIMKGVRNHVQAEEKDFLEIVLSKLADNHGFYGKNGFTGNIDTLLRKTTNYMQRVYEGAFD